jgi:hypothetical protein
LGLAEALSGLEVLPWVMEVALLDLAAVPSVMAAEP